MGKFDGQIIAPYCWSVWGYQNLLKPSSFAYLFLHSNTVELTISWPLTTIDKQFQNHSLLGASQLLRMNLQILLTISLSR